jgi:hypothetical protein
MSIGDLAESEREMSGSARIAVVGAGPRGLSTLERLCANARDSQREFDIYLIEPHEAGAGAVWRTTQSSQLLMNTVASQITIFTDASVTMEGPIEDGPSLYEWAQTEDYFTGAERLGPDDYPTRATYGRYLIACLDRVIVRAPSNVTIHQIHASVNEIRSPSSLSLPDLDLSDGSVLKSVDSIVLAVGHFEVEMTSGSKKLAAEAQKTGSKYIPPANPADVDLGGIAPAAPVLLRGLGLTFFDYVALLTSGRGGTFRAGELGLEYLPSGLEPVIYAGSRRGIPFHARGRNEKGGEGRYAPRVLTPERIRALQEQHSREAVEFKRDLWPMISREVECTYYQQLLPDPDARERFARAYLSASIESLSDVLQDHRIPPDRFWDWQRIETPWIGFSFPDAPHFHEWMRNYLVSDIALANEGNVSGAVKAALDVLRDLRNEIRLLVDHNGIDGASYRDELVHWYTPLNAFLSIGPPVSRIEELVALIEAGIVKFIGPGMRVTSTGSGFVATSDVVPGNIEASALVEARLPEPDIRRTRNPLLRSMLRSGQCKLFQLRTAGDSIETGGVAVTQRPYRVLSDEWPEGNPRIYAYGIPTETVHWVTAAGARPGVNSVTLRDADAIARAVLSTFPMASRVDGNEYAGQPA